MHVQVSDSAHMLTESKCNNKVVFNAQQITVKSRKMMKQEKPLKVLTYIIYLFQKKMDSPC
jgi:hypothetical protein